MDYKSIITQFANRIKTINAKLKLAVKTDVVKNDVALLCRDMEQALDKYKDEMFYASVYNARATIMTAPYGCSVPQLIEALDDAHAELMFSYLNSDLNI